MERHEAIVLGRRAAREHDRLITLYGPHLGQREALARGSRRVTSKLAAGLEPFGRVLVDLVPGRRLTHLTGVQVLDPYPRLRQRIAGLVQAGVLAEVVLGLTRPGQRDPRLFRLLVRELERIDRRAAEGLTSADVFSLALFLLRTLSLAGWTPDLTHCALCHQPLGSTTARFLSHPFGLRHPTCRGGGPGPPVQFATRRYLASRLQRLTGRPAVVPSGIVRELGALAIASLEAVLDRPIQSRRLLRVLQQSGFARPSTPLV